MQRAKSRHRENPETTMRSEKSNNYRSELSMKEFADPFTGEKTSKKLRKKTAPEQGAAVIKM